MELTLYRALAVLKLVRICWVAFVCEPYWLVYAQSEATPRYTTFWVDGHPVV